ILARLAGDIVDDDREIIERINLNCLWALGQIKRRDDINFDVQRCFLVMSRVTKDAYEVFARMISEELSRVERDVLGAFKHSARRHRPGSIENWRLRLLTQSAILAKADIKSILHDSEQSYALHYFLIDRLILSDSFPHGT